MCVCSYFYLVFIQILLLYAGSSDLILLSCFRTWHEYWITSLVCNFLVLSFLSSWWTCSGNSAWQWAQIHVGLWTLPLCLCCWRSSSLLDRLVRSLLKWPFHSFRYIFITVDNISYSCIELCLFYCDIWTHNYRFISIQIFDKFRIVRYWY